MATIIAKAQATITDLNDGKGVTITESWVKYAYWTPSDGATPPDASDGGWTEDLESVTDGLLDGEGYWTWTHVKYSDGTETNSYSLTAKGETGSGETGEDGKDALVVNVSPSALVFNASSKGIVANATAQAQPATITARYGTKTATVSNLTITSQDNCTAGVSGTKVTISSISQTSAGVTDSDGNIIYVSASSGSVSVSGTATLGTRSEQFNVTIPFTVNMAAKFGSLISNDEKFSSKLAEVTTKNGELETKYASLEQTASGLTSRVGTLETTTDGLQDSYSEISQKTDRIALKVGQTTKSAIRNLLVNSYVRSVRYARKLWTAQLRSGTTYTLSGCGCTSASTYRLRLRCYCSSDTSSYAETIIDSQTLKRGEVTFTAAYSAFYYIVAQAINASGSAVTLSGSDFFHIEYCQLEEGSAATPWTPSLTDDYGEMIDTAKKVTVNDTEYSCFQNDGTTMTTTLPDGTTGKAYYLSSATADAYKELRCWRMFAFTAGNTYTISCWVRGSGSATFFTWDEAQSGTQDLNLWDVCDIEQSPYSNAIVVSRAVTLSSSWRKVEITFTCKTTTSAGTVMFARIAASGHYCYIYAPSVRKWGLSEYPAALQQQNLLATGIDIEQRKLTLTSDNVEVRNNAGQTTALLDSDGNLTAKTLNSTPDDSYGAAITVSGGTLTVKGQGEAKIVLGLDSDGYATLSFYGLDGTKLYDLGPDGISLVRSASWLDKVTLVDLSIFGITSLADGATCSATVNPQLFTTPTSYQTVTLYRYHAYRVNGVAQADGNYGFDSSDADAADNKLFSVISGSVATAASGNFMEQNPTGLALVQSAQSSSVYRWRKFFYNVNSDGEQTTRRCYCSQEAYRKINGIEEGSD